MYWSKAKKKKKKFARENDQVHYFIIAKQGECEREWQRKKVKTVRISSRVAPVFARKIHTNYVTTTI